MALVENSSNVGCQLNSSDDESAPVQRIRRRVQQFSDSDTEKENVQTEDNKAIQDDKSRNNSDSESEHNNIPVKSGLIKSRIQLNGSSSDSDSPSRIESTKNEEQQMRMKNKRNKMKDKFKGLLKSRGKSSKDESNKQSKSSESSQGEVSEPSDSEMSSVAKIKQKIKKSMATMSNICDPDTSDEESEMNKSEMPKQKPRKQQKSTKLIEAKPVRMSAKQAMENMQLIKSESNRMLREKAVSLPYHRPKALSLKDIMSRRKPAVASDGKALPIKMNEEQLKHYALLLEQRQKEMMELCKSESEEEIGEPEEKKDEVINNTEEQSSNTNTEHENVPEKSEIPIECAQNDSIGVNMNVATNVERDTELIQNGVVETSTEADNLNTEVIDSEKQVEMSDTNEQLEDTEKNDSNPDFKLVYNDSVEEENIADQSESICENNPQKDLTENSEGVNDSNQPIALVNTEPESQLISLHYTENNTEEEANKSDKVEEVSNEIEMADGDKNVDFFSDDDVNMEDIDRLIENAEIMKEDDTINSPMLIRDPLPSNAKPKLTGAPGMVIDLDGGGFMPKKLSGVELLKERFTYFARLKTPEEIEREKEKKLKPGAQHLKLKQELEEKIAEQRSLEWAKRLEEEKQLHMEMDTILDDADDSFEKIESKLDDNDKDDAKDDSSSESGEEEPEENDIEIKDKPRKHNAMLDEEAEQSDCDENEDEAELSDKEDNEELEGDEAVAEQDDDDEEESSDDESSESEVEETTKVKKGRILKAFEDSDDEDATTKPVEPETVVKDNNETNEVDAVVVSNDVQSSSQDDVIQLAQRHQSASDDLFTSQESSTVVEKAKDGINASDEVPATQTFSILDSTSGCNNIDMEFKSPSQINVLCMSQPYKDPAVDAIVDGSQLPITQSSQSQPIGEDILALCTGKFYDNEFVSPSEIDQYVEGTTQDLAAGVYFDDTQPNKPNTIDDLSKVDNPLPEIPTKDVEENKNQDANSVKPNTDGNLLKSILDELDDPEFDKPKANKFFTGGNTQKKDNDPVVESTQMKKKFTIDSDDDEPKETNSELEDNKRKKKLKKKKPEKRALQISDDEEEEEELEQEEDDYISDLEEDTERLVEYDSEENEIEVKADKPKKKRKVTDFFEQEAELTSEDEWVGSGDEDEKGLDRMEREAGDDEVFHQGKLRRELGQIHMRDVLDQDKREVRIIQELLFEDGDLGDGHRQRKFRWRNAGDGDETGTVPDEFADTQEEEFESEEQWRKQRHEREVFLRQMQQEEDDGNLNVTVNRTTIIKANLSSKSMSTLLQEVNQVNKQDTAEAPVVKEKNTAKDIPSPKKSFSIFQQNYHGSLLTRGRGALARLAALATPLAADDDAPKIGTVTTHKRNFVFTALTQDDDDAPKVTVKRKADTNLETPKLMKKMKLEEKQARPKSSLLDHLNL